MSQKGGKQQTAKGNGDRMTTRQQASKIPRSQGVKGGSQTSNQPSTSNASSNQAAASGGSANDQEVPVMLELIDVELKQPSHPAQVGKILADKGFKSFTDIRRLGKFRFRIETKNPSSLKQLKLDKENLRLWDPKLKDQVICFVGGVPLDIEVQDIIKTIEVEAEVLKVERMKTRNHQKVLTDSENIKITLKGTKVPEVVKIFGCCFRCELYVFPIRQCEKCWRYGHGTRFCTYNRAKCRSCGGENCRDECTRVKRCVNCNNEHEANSQNCPERKRRQRILREMKTNKKSYVEAEELHPKLTNRFNGLEEEVFPSLEEGEVPPRPRNGSNRRFRSRSTRGSTGTVQHQEPTHSRERQPERQPNKDTQCRCSENTLKATDLERFLHKLRQDLIAEIRARNWLRPLIELQSKIVQSVQAAKSDLDKDRILIEIANDIKSLIEENTQHPDDQRYGETRTTTACNSGV